MNAPVINSESESLVVEEPKWKTKLEKIRSFLAPLNNASEKSSSREEFLNRLSTFQTGLWFGKPVDPPKCARYGWTLKEANLLHCSTCGEYLCADLPSPSKFKTYKESCRRLEEKVVTSHGKFCCWPLSPDSETVLHLPSLSNKELLKLIEDKVAILSTSLGKDLEFNFSDVEEDDLLNWINEKLGKSYELRMLRLILRGWVSKSPQGKLACSYCSRSWFPEPITSEDNVEEDEPEPKRQRISDSLKVDPLLQHHCWCAWRNETNGWKTYVNQLRHWQSSEKAANSTNANEATPHRATSITETVRNVRKILEA